MNRLAVLPRGRQTRIPGRPAIGNADERHAWYCLGYGQALVMRVEQGDPVEDHGAAAVVGEPLVPEGDRLAETAGRAVRAARRRTERAAAERTVGGRPTAAVASAQGDGQGCGHGNRR
jgi:hypothetical protein